MKVIESVIATDKLIQLELYYITKMPDQLKELKKTYYTYQKMLNVFGKNKKLNLYDKILKDMNEIREVYHIYETR